MANFAEELGLVPAAGSPAPAPVDSAAAAAPATAPPAGSAPAVEQTPPSEEKGLLGRIVSDVGQTALDAVPAVLRGASKGIQEVDRAAFDFGNFLNDKVLDLGRIEITRKGVKWVRGEGNAKYEDAAAITKPLEAVTPGPANSVGGGMIEGVTQFLTGFAVGGRLLKSTGLFVKGAGAVPTLANSSSQSMFSGAAAFDPSEERFSNVLNSILGDPITEYLSAKPDDTRAEGRLKNAIENAGLNLPVEALFLGVKGLRLKREGKLDEARALADDVARELETWHGNAAEPVIPDSAKPGDPKAPAAGGSGGSASPFGDTDKSKVARKPREASTPLDAPPEHVGDLGEVQPFKPEFKWSKGSGEELLDRIGEALRNPEKMSADIRESVHKNLNRVNNADEAKFVANEMGRMAVRDYDRMMGPSVTIEQYEKEAIKAAKQVADYTGTDWRDFVMLASADRVEMRKIMERTIGYRVMTEQASARTGYLAKLIDSGDLTKWGGDRTEAVREFLQAAQMQHAIAPTTEGIKSEFGRALSTLRGKVGPSDAQGKLPSEGIVSAEAKAAGNAASPKAAVEGAVAKSETDQLVAALAGDTAQLDRLIRRLALAGDNPKASLKVTRDFYGAGLMDVHNEVLINALLSGPKTSVVNTTMGLLKSAVVMPGEQLLAGAIKGDVAMMRMAADQWAGFVVSMKDALRVTSQSLKLGDAVLDPTHQGMGATRHAITPETFGLNTDTPLGAFVEGFGALVRLPTRLLTTQDELLKQLNYRARLYAMANREARAMKAANKGASKEELSDFVSQYMERGFDPDGRAVNAEALAWARDATFTSDLKAQTWSGGRTFGETMTEMTNNHPALRAVMPFIRVPTNIMRDLWDHTPGMNLLRAQFRAELQAGGERGAMAKAKMLTGGALWTVAISSALSGDIVGAMPSDPNIARKWREAGIEPNSIRYDKGDGTYGYIGIGRLDPYSSVLSLAATYADLTRGTESWRSEDIAQGMAIALAKNIESKTYLQGLVDLLQAIGNPEQGMQRFMQQRAAAYIPQITNSFKGADYLTDPHTMAQAMLAKTANYGQVDRRFNSIGEPVQAPKTWGPDWLSPITLGNEDDGVLSEIARLATIHKGGIGMPAKKIGSGNNTIDLTALKVGEQSAYARAQELSSQVQIGGKTLRDQLTALFASDRYMNKMVDGEPGTPGSRLEATSALIQGYRQRARDMMMKESPEFAAQYRAYMHHKVDVGLHGWQSQQ